MATNPLQFPSSGSLLVEFESMDEDCAIVRCHGKLVRETAGELNRVVKLLLGRCRHIALDLEDVSQIDSGGFGVLMALKASVTRCEPCSIELCGTGAPVMELLRATRTLSVFDRFRKDTVEESILDKRRELEAEELQRNPDAKFAQED